MFLVAKVHMPGEVITRFWVDDQLLPQDSTTHATSNTGSLGLYISKRCKNTSNTVNIDVGLSFVDIRQANINLQRMGKNSAPPQTSKTSVMIQKRSGNHILRPFKCIRVMNSIRKAPLFL